MLESSPLEEVTSDISIEFNSVKQAEIVFNSIYPEFSTAPNYRSSMEINQEGKFIYISIVADDSTSFRASFNSAIKWIKLSLEINQLINL